MVGDSDLEEKLMQVAFSDPRETSPEIFAKLGRTLRDGEILFREGENSTELIIIVSGRCKITKMVSGEEKVLAILGAEEILGEMSHFDDAPRSATARAVGTLNVLSFSRENFGMIFELHHKWTLKLIQALSTRIHGTFMRLVQAHDQEPGPVLLEPESLGLSDSPSPIGTAQQELAAGKAPFPRQTPPTPPVPRPATTQAARPTSPPPAATPMPPRPEAVPVGLDASKVEKFLADMRAAIRRGAVLNNLKQKALERLAIQPEQKRRIEQLFAYAERRFKSEGLIA